ncbi:MAG TPA: hypothetical protein VGI64_07435 [Streptosporangiaceae bacterium]
MIIVVEGPSAAGKTTWLAAHCRPATVIGGAAGGGAPDRALDPEGAARHWAGSNAARWQAACSAERRTGTAVCDTDPLKLHYVWSLWQAGHATRRQWQAELTATRQLFAEHRLGIADLILVETADPATLAARRRADPTRRRRNFGLHVQLAGPLRDWYQAVELLDPDRVRWELPATGLPGSDLGPRRPRTGTDTFDALLSKLPAR